MKQQILYFFQDVRKMLGNNKFRIIIIWFSRVFIGIFVYRLERGLFLTIGNSYNYLRIPFYPVLILFQVYSNIDIHYKANIKGGIHILHPAASVVISGRAVIGYNLTLVGGNIIGVSSSKKGDFILGDYCSLGANAVIIGPVVLTDKITIGASACVTQNCLTENSILIGVPAKILKTDLV